MFWNTLPDITTVLNVIAITICPASGAMVELGFSLMNLIINDLQSSKSIKTLDATMHIQYNGPDLSDKEADKIIDVWNRRINKKNWIVNLYELTFDTKFTGCVFKSHLPV